jgi:hypothetical protein
VGGFLQYETARAQRPGNERLTVGKKFDFSIGQPGICTTDTPLQNSFWPSKSGLGPTIRVGSRIHASLVESAQAIVDSISDFQRE